MAKERDYKKEYRDYHGTREQKQRRADRNRERRKALRDGRVRKGDDREVHHVGAKRKGSLRNTPTRVVSRDTNRRIQPKRS